MICRSEVVLFESNISLVSKFVKECFSIRLRFRVEDPLQLTVLYHQSAVSGHLLSVSAHWRFRQTSMAAWCASLCQWLTLLQMLRQRTVSSTRTRHHQCWDHLGCYTGFVRRQCTSVQEQYLHGVDQHRCEKVGSPIYNLRAAAVRLMQLEDGDQCWLGFCSPKDSTGFNDSLVLLSCDNVINFFHCVAIVWVPGPAVTFSSPEAWTCYRETGSDPDDDDDYTLMLWVEFIYTSSCPITRHSPISTVTLLLTDASGWIYYTSNWSINQSIHQESKSHRNSDVIDKIRSDKYKIREDKKRADQIW